MKKFLHMMRCSCPLRRRRRRREKGNIDHMMMNSTENYFLLFRIRVLTTCSSLLILSLPFFQTCHANCTSTTSSSSCGLLRNISFPFRLKNDPSSCGDHKYELACENDVASIYLKSGEYYVKAIDYHNYTFRIVDASINSSRCSFSTSSSFFTFDYFEPLSPYYYNHEENQQISFMSCQHPLRNPSPLLIQATGCEPGRRHSYIKIGDIHLTEMEYNCTLEAVVPTSWKFRDFQNVTLTEIHQSLLYGFELYFWVNWQRYTWSTLDKLVDFFVFRLSSPIFIVLVVVVLLSAVISPPVTIIIGFVVVVGLVLHVALIRYRYGYVNLGRDFSNITPSIIMICQARFIICPLIVWLLIYKFRTRHMSMYEEIEGFLQSDNRLAPIRYSYSDIKKMTRGFRVKLGEGGFGSVYKGKLRSGNHVAVKLLRESKGKVGQDFMNEIASIGRIHHVNVVQLVGYCAERSKCALIFDFMPNGSLEKYIFNREKTYSLDWDKKFEIAVGVARGIEYLHCGCDIQILHFDIKPHNILLDEKFVPKVSDFGLAKLCSVDKEIVTMTAVRGTIGYVAPELINRSIGAVSFKADVYSFGMLLMEMVGLNREFRGSDDDTTKYFPCWIYDRFNEGMDFEIEMEMESDGNDENENSRKSLVRKMTIVALWCIQMNPNDRPSMNKALAMLEGDVERLQIPDYPSQSAAHTGVTVEESWTTGAIDSASLLHCSNIDSSIEITID